LLAALVAAAVSPAGAQDRADISLKGSLLYYSKIELRWVRDAAGGFVLTQDTFISILNDCSNDVDVQFYFVNGDPPALPILAGDPPVQIERGHRGWNWVDCQFTLTSNQPAYFAASTGLPTFSTDFPGSPPAQDPMCQPFDTLDPGFPPGRPDPDNPRNGRVLRGFAFAFAVAADADSVNRQIRWNHLSGSGILVNYAQATAAEYSAMAFNALGGLPCGDEDAGGQCSCCELCSGNGLPIGTPGVLNLDGQEYSFGPDKLLFDFYATGSTALSGQLAQVSTDTDITLHPISVDARQDGNGRVTSKAVFDIWNQNEVRFSGTEKCVSCWDQTLVRRYPAPNHLLRQNLQTDKGKARINGVASAICVSPGVATVPPFPADPSENASLLGLTIKELTFISGGKGGPNVSFGRSALNMTGQGEEAGQIRYDLVDALQNREGSLGTVDSVEGADVESAPKVRPSTHGGR
jgi:hypothetical protein